MSRIDDMIKELCPEGVKRMPLKDVCITQNKGGIRKGELYEVGRFPVINSAREILGYFDKYNNDEDTLVITSHGAYAGFCHYLSMKFWAGGLCFPFKSIEGGITKYLYYYIKEKENYIRENYVNQSGVPYINFSNLGNLIIPFPPLSIQQEIVSVLDSFTTLIDKMKQEVEKRKKQMEYYCDLYYGGDIEGMMLLANDSSNSVITFAELGTITRGKRFVRDDVRESGQPCIHYGDMYTYYGTKSYKTNTYLDRDFPKKMRYANKGDVVIVGAGENDYDIGVGVVWMGDEPAAVHDACYILEHNQNPMYISYYLRSNIYHQQLKKHVSSGKISSFSAEGLGKVYIPILPMERQSEIVTTLDKFESYIMKLEKMIALRQKQYEYYREQLLTF